MDTKDDNATIDIDSMAAGADDTIYTIDSAQYQYDYGGLASGTINISSLGAVGNGSVLGNITVPNSIYTTTTTGTGGYNWNIGAAPTTISQGGRISLQGESADIEINGRSMSDWMAKVEERLNILMPNPELEREWDQLRRLGERYRKLEKKCKDKAEMWKQLKKMPAPRPEQF